MPSLPNLYFECSWWLPEAQPCCLPRDMLAHTISQMRCNHCAHKCGFGCLIYL